MFHVDWTNNSEMITIRVESVGFWVLPANILLDNDYDNENILL